MGRFAVEMSLGRGISPTYLFISPQSNLEPATPDNVAHIIATSLSAAA
jgi:hypothetical protein